MYKVWTLDILSVLHSNLALDLVKQKGWKFNLWYHFLMRVLCCYFENNLIFDLEVLARVSLQELFGLSRHGCYICCNWGIDLRLLGALFTVCSSSFNRWFIIVATTYPFLNGSTAETDVNLRTLKVFFMKVSIEFQPCSSKKLVRTELDHPYQFGPVR